MTQAIVTFIGVLAVALYVRVRLHRVVVYEYQRGLLYVRGQLRAVLDAGQYWVWAPSRSIMVVDVRPRVTAVPGQEVLTADGVAVKVSLVAQYRIVDPALAVNGQVDYAAALYTELQLAIRRVISAESIDSLLQNRPYLAAQLLELGRPESARLGLELISADLKDLTLPGELKKLFTQVTKARQEGLAALERARGETAALRNLANAARLVSDNPALMQLRLLQVVGEQSGNTVVLGVPSTSAPIPVPLKERNAAPRPDAPDTSES